MCSSVAACPPHSPGRDGPACRPVPGGMRRAEESQKHTPCPSQASQRRTSLLLRAPLAAPQSISECFLAEPISPLPAPAATPDSMRSRAAPTGRESAAAACAALADCGGRDAIGGA